MARFQFIESLPGNGPILGAEFIAVVGDLSAYKEPTTSPPTPGQASVPRDFGRKTVTGVGRGTTTAAAPAVVPVRANGDGPARKLPRLLSQNDPEGMIHTQAVICLARGLVNALWATLRDHRPVRDHPAAPSHSLNV